MGFTEILESQETEMSRYMATMFLAYCIMDLAIANVEYVNELDWESGGLHHVSYAVFCSYLLYNKQTMFFSIFLIEEIPTIYLTWKRIQGKKELKWIFASFFYLTRILYHSVATYALLEQSTICFAVGLLVLRQHMQWFGRWWTSQGMKLKQAQLTLKQKLTILCTMVVMQLGTHFYISVRYWETPTMSSIRDSTLHIGAYMYFTFKMITVCFVLFDSRFFTVSHKYENSNTHTGTSKHVLRFVHHGCNQHASDYLQHLMGRSESRTSETQIQQG